MRKARQACWLAAITVCFSCSENRWESDTKSIDYRPSFVRLDHMVFDPSHTPSLAEFYRNRPEIVNAYTFDIMQIAPYGNAMTQTLLDGFRTDPNWQEMQAIVDQTFPDLKKEEAELGSALKRYAVFFDRSDLPLLVAYNSGFNYGVYPDSTWLGIGLEWYCGGDNAVVKRLPPDLFPQYKRQNMATEYLVPNALTGWISVKMERKFQGNRLLDYMIFAGKARYTAEVLLESRPTANIFNYSEKEMAFCIENEFKMWDFIVGKDLLFTTDLKIINQFTGDGPFTPGMPPESPGGVANWLGYRMVNAYMEAKKDKTLLQLWDSKEAQEILKYYKPKK